MCFLRVFCGFLCVFGVLGGIVVFLLAFVFLVLSLLFCVVVGVSWVFSILVY